MKKGFIICIIIFTCCFSCGHKNKSTKTANDSIINIKNDSIMGERYDYESTDGGKKTVYIEQNGWVIRKSSIEGGAFYNMYPPPPEFYKITKVFYPNGNIKYETKFLGGVEIDTSREYSEDGYLVKEVNENKKFGTIKPTDILKFLEKEGWIDLKTGKGRTTMVIKDSKLYSSEDCVFELRFELVGESYFIKNNKVPIWVVIITGNQRNKFEETTYLIDGETGIVLKKEKKDSFKPV